ncbi:MmgE/PrpD family protein [Actinophytocola sp.]|uniref:MmgE/PrpD family protein n=1 Tax=Actinophytocola sp. TaxID=1872138 RepID=UPI003D6C24F1
MSATSQIVEFAQDFRPDDAPASTYERLTVLVADNVAAGLIGARQPWHGIVRGQQKHLGGTGSAASFGTGTRFDPSRAALVNGVAISGYEFEHAHEGGHPGATVFPALLALAQQRRASTENLLRALVIGYELGLRTGLGLTARAERERGFHRPAIGGVIGSAIGTSVLLGLSAERMVNAVGIAASHACGIIAFTQNGSMTKRLHLGRASQLGLESALLAEGGFTGPDAVLEGPYGLLAAFSPTPAPDAIVESLGSRWHLEDSLVKQYNCHGECQSAVAAARRFAESRPVDLGSIEKVVLRTSSNGGEPRYHGVTGTTALDAQYSLPLMIALALATDPRGTDEFWTLLDKDPAVRELASRVEIVAQPERFGVRAIVGGGELELHVDGETHVVVTPPRSMPEDPARSREIVAGKLDSCRAGVGPDGTDAVFLRIADDLVGGTPLTDGLDRLVRL